MAMSPTERSAFFVGQTVMLLLTAALIIAAIPK
jgi:hypothetical protein